MDQDLLMRSILEGGQEEVPAHVWEGVSAGLDKAARRRKVALWWRRAAVGGAVAAAVAAVLLVMVTAVVVTVERVMALVTGRDC